MGFFFFDIMLMNRVLFGKVSEITHYHQINYIMLAMVSSVEFIIFCIFANKRFNMTRP
jgi:hypothetical protein